MLLKQAEAILRDEMNMLTTLSLWFDDFSFHPHSQYYTYCHSIMAAAGFIKYTALYRRIVNPRFYGRPCCY